MSLGRRSVAKMFVLDTSVKLLDVSGNEMGKSWTFELKIVRPSRCPQCCDKRVWVEIPRPETCGTALLHWDALLDSGADVGKFNHIPGGANVLYMDGHVEFQRYPGRWPATRWWSNIVTF